MDTLAVIALLLVIPALQVQGGAVVNPPVDPPTTPPTSPQPPPDRFDPKGFFKFMKEQAQHALGYAKDFKEFQNILGQEQIDFEALEKKGKEMEEADHVFEGTADFLLKALSALYKKPEGDGPPPMCGSLAGYVKRSHDEQKPIKPEDAVGPMSDDFGCIADKIERVFKQFENDVLGNPDPDEELEVILRTVAKITAVHHTEQRFLRAIEKAFPEEEEEEDSTKRQLLKLLLKRVLEDEPAAKRGLGAIRALLNKKQ